MKSNDLYNQIKAKLASIHDPAYEARIILEETLGISWSDIITDSPCELSAQQEETIQILITQRLEGKPLSRILGQRDFWGLNFTLNDDTLDPRPDTEVLVEQALSFIKSANIKQPNILDLGTGTGCIPISLLHEIPTASATALDLNPRALEATRHNAAQHKVEARLKTVQSNWCESLPAQQAFDVITSNPPYIDSSDIKNLAPEVQKHDPILALDGGEKGLDPYKIIFAQIKKYLKPQGRAFLEIGHDQCGYIQGIAKNYRIRICDIHPDYAGIPRVVEISCGDK